MVRAQDHAMPESTLSVFARGRAAGRALLSRRHGGLLIFLAGFVGLSTVLRPPRTD